MLSVSARLPRMVPHWANSRFVFSRRDRRAASILLCRASSAGYNHVNKALQRQKTMIAHLSEEQRRAVLAGTPVEVRDGDHVFYLISKAEYEAARAALDADEIEPSFFEFDDDQDPDPSAQNGRC
jgi:hypothetical protein